MSDVTTLSTVARAEVLLHYRVSPDPHPRIHAPAYQEAAAFLIKHGALRHENGSAMKDEQFEITPLGEAWVKLLLRIPIPEEKMCYVDRTGKIIA